MVAATRQRVRRGRSGTGTIPVSADTLLMLSGGVDSTWCLWDRVQRGLSTRTHHVHLTDREGRRDVEARAVRDVLQWMDDNGGRELIDHTESSVDFGELWIPPNYFLWAYWIGAISAQSAGLNYRTIIDPLTADDHPEAADASDRAYETLARLMTGRVPNIEHPIRHMRKADLIAAMPAELVDLCWWCRFPRAGQACHSCHTCQLVDATLGHPREAS